MSLGFDVALEKHHVQWVLMGKSSTKRPLSVFIYLHIACIPCIYNIYIHIVHMLYMSDGFSVVKWNIVLWQCGILLLIPVCQKHRN